MDQKTLKQLKKLLTDSLVNVATKDDLVSLEKRFEKKFPTKRDLKKELNKLEMNIIKLVDTHKADKVQLKYLEEQIEQLARKYA